MVNFRVRVEYLHSQFLCKCSILTRTMRPRYRRNRRTVYVSPIMAIHVSPTMGSNRQIVLYVNDWLYTRRTHVRGPGHTSINIHMSTGLLRTKQKGWFSLAAVFTVQAHIHTHNIEGCTHDIHRYRLRPTNRALAHEPAKGSGESEGDQARLHE